MNINRKFELGGPEGLQIYESYIEPAGAYWKNPDVLKFICGGANLSLELQREPRNKYDPNAIKVIGIVRGWMFKKRYHVRYLSRESARKLVLGKFWPRVAANLRRVTLNDEGYMHINFGLLGPVGRKKEYTTLTI